MDAREQRGLVIAAKCRIRFQRGRFVVPSQNAAGVKYEVQNDPAKPTCTCPDFEERQQTCKHIFAVRFTVERLSTRDGKFTTETLTVTETVEKKTTYKQVWPAYNRAQSVEKDRFQELLFDLCRDVPEPEHTGRGRKPHTRRDSLFSMVYKTYSTFSARRFSSDLREAHSRGFLSKPVPGAKTWAFMEDATLAPILTELVAKSALPLRAVETCFAVDSSGFGSNRFETWIDEKYGVPRRKAVWVKAHVVCGVKTNVVTAVRVLEKDTSDCPQFATLVKDTAASGFTIGEASADKAYMSYGNFDTVAGFGGEAFIAFKQGTTAAQGGELERMYHYFQFKKDEYLTHYHKRSNVESTFSMVKRKFGGEVRSKTDDAMKNEVLCKLVAHNLCVLIQEQHELGIKPLFCQDGPQAVAVAPCNEIETLATKCGRLF